MNKIEKQNRLATRDGEILVFFIELASNYASVICTRMIDIT